MKPRDRHRTLRDCVQKENRAENFRMRYPPLSRLLNLSIQWTHSWFFFLNRSFFDIVEKDQKPVFNIREFQLLYINLKWRKISNLSASDTRLWLVEFLHFSGYKCKIYVSLDIKKKRGSSINLDIHHSKVFSSEECFIFFLEIFIWIEFMNISFRFTVFLEFLNYFLIFFCYFYAKTWWTIQR